ncbi:MAG: glucose-methanol-choline oxidoreductase [Herbinix sp.]|jgi:choline dehydrogenase-like flavoprotein|nr:glucose-methanol-choline oxidoreductase [Herbinix sp.]
MVVIMNRIYDTDVIVIGAGAGGAIVAKELAEKGAKVIVLEAGPWYGNAKWPNPNSEHGAVSSSDYEDLSIDLLKKSFTDLEEDMNDQVTGKFRWGPANRNLPPWTRKGGVVWQNAGVGGTTLHYFANSPHAIPQSMDGIWPISYEELVPYYERVEAQLPVHLAPVSPKEELFYYGAKKAGWQYLNNPDVSVPGYRQGINAILEVNPRINDPDFDLQNNNTVGCTLRGHCVNGCHIGPTVEAVAKRSTLVSYIPRALATGNAEIRPNAFVIKVLTEEAEEGIHAIGVVYKDTWTGESFELYAKVIVMAGGGIETPRLWLNSGLPENPWVGKGLTNHWFDTVAGIFEEKVLMDILGVSDIKPYTGQNSAARLDIPGIGTMITMGMSPGIYASLNYVTSAKGYASLNTPDPQAAWDVEGIVSGEQLKDFMREYKRTLSILLFVDDEVNQRNEVGIDPNLRDEYGYIPVIRYQPSESDTVKRDQLATYAAELLRAAGARTIIRANWNPELFIHIMSTMRMGYVVDVNCEAYQVKRLYIADNSVLTNGIGGPNPTLTTQALAARTADKIWDQYFQAET